MSSQGLFASAGDYEIMNVKNLLKIIYFTNSCFNCSFPNMSLLLSKFGLLK